MKQHIHQCPKCFHIWVCDSDNCKADLHEKDRRCMVDGNPDIAKLSRLPVSPLDRTQRYIRRHPQNWKHVRKTP